MHIKTHINIQIFKCKKYPPNNGRYFALVIDFFFFFSLLLFCGQRFIFRNKLFNAKGSISRNKLQSLRDNKNDLPKKYVNCLLITCNLLNE